MDKIESLAIMLKFTQVINQAITIVPISTEY